MSKELKREKKIKNITFISFTIISFLKCYTFLIHLIFKILPSHALSCLHGIIYINQSLHTNIYLKLSKNFSIILKNSCLGKENKYNLSFCIIILTKMEVFLLLLIISYTCFYKIKQYRRKEVTWYLTCKKQTLLTLQSIDFKTCLIFTCMLFFPLLLLYYLLPHKGYISCIISELFFLIKISGLGVRKPFLTTRKQKSLLIFLFF